MMEPLYSRIPVTISQRQPKKYPEVDAFINSLSRQAWREIVGAYAINGNNGIVNVLRERYSYQFRCWGDQDLLLYLKDRKMSNFLPALERSEA